VSTHPQAYITEEQYLELDEAAEQKSEYFRGEMFPIEASLAHGMITDNLLIALSKELGSSGCRAFSRPRIKVSSTGLYSYPDIVIICGKPHIAEKRYDSITNPKIIIEILSPTTEDYDRGGKFVRYRSIPSFTEYLLVAQDRIYAEHWIKQPDGGWLLHETVDPGATINLESVGARFKLSEAYPGVDL
jgi:Uma2 family endonuclease